MELRQPVEVARPLRLLKRLVDYPERRARFRQQRQDLCKHLRVDREILPRADLALDRKSSLGGFAAAPRIAIACDSPAVEYQRLRGKRS